MNKTKLSSKIQISASFDVMIVICRPERNIKQCLIIFFFFFFRHDSSAVVSVFNHHSRMYLHLYILLQCLYICTHIIYSSKQWIFSYLVDMIIWPRWSNIAGICFDYSKDQRSSRKGNKSSLQGGRGILTPLPFFQ